MIVNAQEVLNPTVQGIINNCLQTRPFQKHLGFLFLSIMSNPVLAVIAAQYQVTWLGWSFWFSIRWIVQVAGSQPKLSPIVTLAALHTANASIEAIQINLFQ